MSAIPNAWTSHGITLPNGTQMRMTYHGKTHHGYIHAGLFHVWGQTAETPSGATKIIVFEHLNGWDYWFARRPGDADWSRLSDLRRGL